MRSLHEGIDPWWSCATLFLHWGWNWVRGTPQDTQDPAMLLPPPPTAGSYLAFHPHCIQESGEHQVPGSCFHFCYKFKMPRPLAFRVLRTGSTSLQSNRDFSSWCQNCAFVCGTALGHNALRSPTTTSSQSCLYLALLCSQWWGLIISRLRVGLPPQGAAATVCRSTADHTERWEWCC